MQWTTDSGKWLATCGVIKVGNLKTYMYMYTYLFRYMYMYVAHTQCTCRLSMCSYAIEHT